MMAQQQQPTVSSPKKTSSVKEAEAPATPTTTATTLGNVFVALSAASTAEALVGQKRSAPDSAITDDDLLLALQRARDRCATLVANLRAKRTQPLPDTVPVNIYHARVHRDYAVRTTTVLDSVLQNSDNWTLNRFRAVTGHPHFPFLVRFGATLNIYVYGPRYSKVLVHTDTDVPTMRHDDLRAYNATLK